MQHSKWHPSEGVTRHSGGAIAADTDFFVAPSPEIGTIITADSNLVTSKQEMETSKCWMFILLGAFLGGAFFQILPLIFGLGSSIGWHIASVVSALTVGLIIHTKTSFSYLCSYVGDQGIEEHKISGSRQGKLISQRLKFNEAEDLYTAQTRMYTNGVYTGTNYLYKWIKSGTKPFRLAGSYHNKKGWPEEGHAWHCANSGEAVWSNYRLRQLNQDLDKQGFIEFAMKGNPKAVRVGSGFLEFVLKDNSTQRVGAKDMKKITLGSGNFNFVHNNAKWWSGKGKYSFNYSNLPNAKLFLLCLDRLVGISWS
ncbi:hypothetical protein Lepto7376_3834 [[Leptolyngbya] sp. PCC 7376]|uniref:hypothetical protein n=1 Tax=[Leptolyngbya] sp. PCC 7376 TaxID=111781 RepID=UPI00029ED8F1|nr:hypothetical protein [[Leptolyngbya] sp. PCC 7376]AFY39991.1 hypothetical protein Lepto7376_3834 [[Leptolyngbya] sp. PCC 7376]